MCRARVPVHLGLDRNGRDCEGKCAGKKFVGNRISLGLSTEYLPVMGPIWFIAGEELSQSVDCMRKVRMHVGFVRRKKRRPSVTARSGVGPKARRNLAENRPPPDREAPPSRQCWRGE